VAPDYAGVGPQRELPRAAVPLRNFEAGRSVRCDRPQCLEPVDPIPVKVPQRDLVDGYVRPLCAQGVARTLVLELLMVEGPDLVLDVFGLLDDQLMRDLPKLVAKAGEVHPGDDVRSRLPPVRVCKVAGPRLLEGHFLEGVLEALADSLVDHRCRYTTHRAGISPERPARRLDVDERLREIVGELPTSEVPIVTGEIVRMHVEDEISADRNLDDEPGACDFVDPQPFPFEWHARSRDASKSLAGHSEDGVEFASGVELNVHVCHLSLRCSKLFFPLLKSIKLSSAEV
jgi:hypothetical protein